MDVRLVVARGGDLLRSEDSEEVADDFECRIVVVELEIPLVLLRERLPIIATSHQSPATIRERKGTLTRRGSDPTPSSRP
jgi:hypothetical protein